MPYTLAQRNNRLTAVGLSLIFFSTTPFALGAPIDKMLIESATLIHHDELTDPGFLNPTSRLRRAIVPATDIENIVDTAFPASGGPSSDFASTMKGLFKGQGDNNNSEINDAVESALIYIRDQKDSFGLDVEQIGLATQALVQAALEASAERNTNPDPAGLAGMLPAVVVKTFIPVAARNWGESVPDLAKSLTEGVAKGARTSNLPPAERDGVSRTITEGVVTVVLEQIRDSVPDPLRDVGFIPGIVPVDPSGGTADATMALDGLQAKHKAFHPYKTRILEYAVNGITYGSLIAARDNGYPATGGPSLAEDIGSGAAKAGVEFMAALDPGTDLGKDHSLFTYEVVKSIASGVTLGSIMVSGSHRPWEKEKIAEQVAERVAFGIASSAMQTNFEKEFLPEIERIGEAAAFGSSMGAQFATVFDPSTDNYSAWDYEFYGKEASYDRVVLAEATSRGAAEGAISKAAEFATLDDTQDTTATASRQEILDLARGTAMGSVLSNVAMAIYYDNELQDVITASSKGSSYGSITAENLSKIEKQPGQTEEFEVEVARAVANGATTGTLFEVVGLLDAKPDAREADIDSIISAKSATYGATLGALLGGDESSQDAIAVKQAAEQGASE